MKKNNINALGKMLLLTVLCLLFSSLGISQNSYVGAGSTIYFNGSILTDQVILPNATATVNMTAATSFTGTGYVDSTVNVKGAGVTTVPVGNGGVKSTVDMTTVATDDIATAYIASAATGTLDASLATYALSDAEYWTIAQNAGASADVTVTGLSNTATTYGGEAAIGTPILVRRDNTSSNWVAYASNPGFGEFAYAAETLSLSVETPNVSNFALYPNPVRGNTIGFNLQSSVQQLNITMYDVLGKIVQHYSNVPVQAGANTIAKPNVSNGIYLLQFAFNNGAQTTTKRLIIE
ncbi:T9SS type A sorting domain-containing protein [Winogradskyella sp.]|uniref:T9SS type A sorting domain-containing protein n=1 Tax=Winogradskyella sp. TaxID=1883156 RepID=UPI00261499E8|nr:T9SS type A sorting domain-containing protein [Winogradskyella sp.]